MVDIEEEIRKKLERKEKTYETEQLMKVKRSEEYEALEEVFDKPTLMTIYDLMNEGWIDEIYGAIKAGKESKLYWGIHPDGTELAIKIYLTVTAEFRKGMLTYISGDPRFERIRRNPRSIIYLWARKEFKNLTEAYQAKVRVPKPYTVKNNVLLMEFIGKNGVSAPLLREVELSNPERIYRQIILYIKRLYVKAKLVHGDLSEYNIMVWRGKPVIFDVSQAVSIEHPNADQFLWRDINNINRYFAELGVEVQDPEEIYRRITGAGALR